MSNVRASISISFPVGIFVLALIRIYNTDLNQYPCGRQEGAEMKREKLTIPILLSLWAGLAIGGNLIAASAKFQVTALSTAEHLMIGRAQFAWLGIAEMLLAAALLGGFFRQKRRPDYLLLAILAVLALQQLGLHPLLQLRSDTLIAGQTPGPSNLHLLFIAAEILKICLLLWAAGSLPKAPARAEIL
ncbi:hypothetical protein [Tritonibacter multivorans]|uniref:hypothetical protein n=1 Tax=Tritonibacter multivorans TaxID=928856 RepID=UPI00104152F8|nr:hypothetical protein [Tritonibacter multivorans]MDA7422107.1 hypothetical protein [Tritonibacter multivorans]